MSIMLKNTLDFQVLKNGCFANIWAIICENKKFCWFKGQENDNFASITAKFYKGIV